MQKLDKSLIPNISNLIDAQASPPFDPNREYSLPWLVGHGRASPGTRRSPAPVDVASTQLFEDPKLKGKVTVLSEMADTVGLVMLDNGDDPANVDRRGVRSRDRPVQARRRLRPDPTFTGNDYAQPLVRATSRPASRGRATSSSSCSTTRSSSGAFRRRAGSSGPTTCSSRTGGSVPTASTYMNFVYDPKIAAQIALGTSYISSVKGAKEEAREDRSGAANNTLIFPSDETLAQLHQNDSEDGLEQPTTSRRGRR